MKKAKMLLSFAVLFGLTSSLLAEIPKDMKKECFVPPQQRENRDCDEEMMFACDIDIPQQDFGSYEKLSPEAERDFDKKFLEDKLNKLKLTDKQKQDFKKLTEKSKKEINELTKKFKSKVRDLNNEFYKEKYNAKDVKNLVKDIKAISAKIIDSKAEKKEELRKILTDKQYNKMFKPKTKYDVLAERLGLTEDQKEKFIGILERKKEQEEPLKQQLRDFEKEIREEFEKDEIDMAVVTRLSNEISNITTKLFKIDLNSKIELKSVLSTEQYKKYTNPNHPKPILPIKPVKPVKPIIYEPMDSNKSIDKK
jgi:Spy/CpxP family protein refolding chaperone